MRDWTKITNTKVRGIIRPFCRSKVFQKLCINNLWRKIFYSFFLLRIILSRSIWSKICVDESSFYLKIIIITDLQKWSVRGGRNPSFMRDTIWNKTRKRDKFISNSDSLKEKKSRGKLSANWSTNKYSLRETMTATWRVETLVVEEAH